MRHVLLLLAASSLFAFAGCGGQKGAAEDELVIVWAKWEPADALAKLCQKYTEETGKKVVVEQIPWQNFGDKIRNVVWAGKSAEYDIIIGDSQWLGQAVTQGHYVDLTEWMEKAVRLRDIAPEALKLYGEYPAGSGKYYALPCEFDAIGFAYRKDKFEDPKEREAFRAKYGYDLAPPKTWTQLRDIAEFFTRPQDNTWGVAVFYSKGYDALTMGFQQILWCWGADWADPNTGDPMGAINSDKAVEALKFYIDLKRFNPIGAEDYYFDETKNAFKEGLVVMAMEWYAFMPGFADKQYNPYADVTGYFVSPGEVAHAVSLGGQGMSISTYSKRQSQAKEFMQWFAKEENQREWARLGGLTANVAVLKSDDFKNAKPYNQAFSDTAGLLRDFTNNPVYQEMLDVSQEKLHAAVTGQISPKEALDAIAAAHRKILIDANLLKAK